MLNRRRRNVAIGMSLSLALGALMLLSMALGRPARAHPLAPTIRYVAAAISAILGGSYGAPPEEEALVAATQAKKGAEG